MSTSRKQNQRLACCLGFGRRTSDGEFCMTMLSCFWYTHSGLLLMWTVSFPWGVRQFTHLICSVRDTFMPWYAFASMYTEVTQIQRYNRPGVDAEFSHIPCFHCWNTEVFAYRGWSNSRDGTPGSQQQVSHCPGTQGFCQGKTATKEVRRCSPGEDNLGRCGPRVHGWIWVGRVVIKTTKMLGLLGVPTSAWMFPSEPRNWSFRSFIVLKPKMKNCGFRYAHNYGCTCRLFSVGISTYSGCLDTPGLL